MLDLGLELVNSLLKHGISWAAACAFVVALLKNRKAILKLLHRGQEQETQLDQIQRDVRAIKEHLGVVDWDAERSNLSADGARNTSNSRWAVMSRVGIVVAFIRRMSSLLMSRVNLFKSRGKRTMKTLFQKYTSTKLQALIVATIMNVALLVGYVLDVQDIQSKVEAWMPMANLVVQTILTIAYQWARASVDKEELKAQTPEVTTYDASSLDATRKESEGV